MSAGLGPRCEALMNTHLAMGWSPCGKAAPFIVTKRDTLISLCAAHYAQHREASEGAVKTPVPSAVSDEEGR